MRSLLELSAPVRRPRPVVAAPVFAQFGSGPFGWPGFLISLLAHLGLLALLPTLMRQVAVTPQAEASARHDRILRTLRIRIPEQLYLTRTASPRKAFKVFYVKAPRAAKARTPQASGTRRRARRSFELPPLARRAGTDQTLLQPGHPLDLLPPPELQLPELFFWAPPMPKQALRPFVQPGYAEPPVARMRLNQPPRLDAASLGTIAVTPGAGALRLAPPPAAPIQTSAGGEHSPGAVADPVAGDPTQVLAISAQQLPVREFVTVPAGNQVGRTPGAEPSGTLAAATQTAAGPDRSRPAEPPMPGAEHPAPEAAETPKPAASPPPAGTEKPHAGAAERSIEPVPPPAPSPPAFWPAVEATRIQHPADGIFDVVVQAGGPTGLTDSPGVLSGKPVYSVYLRVGGQKDWILQYCIPAADVPPPSVSGSVVVLGAPARTEAPYPLVTYRVPTHQNRSGYLMVHGFILADGRFRDLRVLGTHDPAVSSVVLAVLERWEFRPAKHGGNPTRVEVLVAIPSE